MQYVQLVPKLYLNKFISCKIVQDAISKVINYWYALLLYYTVLHFFFLKLCLVGFHYLFQDFVLNTVMHVIILYSVDDDEIDLCC
jgi:hypothetical protein